MPELATLRGFVDRGLITDWDFIVSAFVTDGDNHSFSLSSLVPTNAKAVLLNVQIQDQLIGMVFQVFSKNIPGNLNRTVGRTQVANTTLDFEAICSIDSTRLLGYNASSGTLTTISLCVKGWWI